MKINKLSILRTTLALASMLSAGVSYAQCPTITCPGNISVNNTPGSCGAVVTYTAPVGTNPCGGQVSQTFNYTGGMQTFTVPAGVTTLTIDAYGAEGGTSTQGNFAGGLGARIKGDVSVTPGQVINVLVGGRGSDGTCGSGGGGGSFVERAGNIHIIAGGGGGGFFCFALGGVLGGAGQTGTSGGSGISTPGRFPSVGGSNGNGATSYYGGGGGGWLSAGVSQAVGGTGGGAYPGAGGNPGGGYGGGGGYYNGCCGGSGGGGGYSGGGGSANGNDGNAGGGGGSINNGTNQTNTSGVQSGNGQVIITYGSAPTTTQTAGLASGSTFPVGVTTNTFQVNDGLGNTASCSFTVTVVDNQIPLISCPGNISVNNTPGTCGAVVTFNAPVGSDNCAVTTTRTAGMASGSTFPVGITTQTYVATDASGNTATCSFTITVTDNQAPLISCPGNIAVNNDPGTCGAVVTYNSPVASDNCSVIVTQTAGLQSGAIFPIGSTTNTFVATDPAGLTSSCSFIVNVTDNQAPTISCSGNVNSCVAVVNGIAPTSANDNCGGTSITYALTGATTGNGNNDASGTTFNVGTTTVTYTITDASGSPANCSFNVTVNPSYNTSATAAICQGKSIILGGAAQTQAGTYIDSLYSIAGCDSVVSTVLAVNPLPTVTLAPFANDTVCITIAPFPLPQGTPAGGMYSGAGVVGANFSPTAAGVGNHMVVYTFTDANGCQNTDSSLVNVSSCLGIEDGSAFQPSVYPNPTNGQLTIVLGNNHKSIEVTVMELNGQVVMSEKHSNTNQLRMDISSLASGMYFMTVKADGQISKVKIAKN